jgi:glyoxylase-like metal-dependent hydrolase (beta-lactamase superfamily II)
MDPNVTFIVNDDTWLWWTRTTPASAEASIRALRAIATRPVRTVINTHWHVDHTSGNQVYRREFPGVEFVGQRLTRDDLAAKGAQNRKDMGEQAAQFVAMLRGLLTDEGGGPIRRQADGVRRIFRPMSSSPPSRPSRSSRPPRCDDN